MEITHDTFNDLSNLLELGLSRNQIITLLTLFEDVFKSLINLRILYLNQNRIEIIDSRLFFHNQNLYVLDISDNNLKTIEPKSFRMLEKMEFLNIYNNPSLNSTDFWFEKGQTSTSINMYNCAFTQLFIPMNVNVIYAGNNKINNITAHPNAKLRSLSI